MNAVSDDRSPEDLGEQIANLTLADCAKLVQYLDEKHGLKPSVSFVQPKQEIVPEEKPPEKTEFDVILDSFEADKKITIIKVWREISSQGLKEAKEQIEGGVGKTLKQNIQKVEAEAIKAKLESAGAKVSIK
jgi:large subunit ribosomal protein L7/L12